MGDVLEVIVLAKDLDDYRESVGHILPGYERYHGVKFQKQGDVYVCDKAHIRPGVRIEDYEGREGYQLMKFGLFTENPDYDLIITHHKEDVQKRMKKAPSMGQD